MSIELVRNLPIDHPYRWDGTIFGGDKLWQPDQVGPDVWFDAADASTVVESGGSVSQWNDKSGNDFHAIQSTSGLQPAYGARQYNGLNVVDFQNDYLVSPDVNYSALRQPNISIFAFFKGDTLLGSNGLFGNEDGGFDRFVYLAHTVTSDQWGIGTGSNTQSLDSDRSPDTDPHILSVKIENLATDKSSVALDGTDPILYTETNTGSMRSKLAVGALNNDGLATLEGFIGELLLFGQILTDADFKRMEGYLAWKWSFESSLPGGHPYKNTPPIIE